VSSLGASKSPFGADLVVTKLNCTEVYRRDDAGCRIIQTRWSFTHPPGTQG